MRPRQTSAIVNSRSNACLIRSQVTASMFGSNSIKVESANAALVESCPLEGPRTMNWPLLLFTVRTPPAGSAAQPVDAISKPRMIARVFIVGCRGLPDAAGLVSTPHHLPSAFGLAGFDSAFGAGFGSDFGAGLPSPPVEGAGDSFLAASL